MCFIEGFPSKTALSNARLILVQGKSSSLHGLQWKSGCLELLRICPVVLSQSAMKHQSSSHKHTAINLLISRLEDRRADVGNSSNSFI